MSANEITDESYSFSRIGAGSFATVCVWRGGPCAYKIVHNMNDTFTLRSEHQTLITLHSLSSCNPDSFFALPRAFAYFNPSTGDIDIAPLSAVDQDHPRRSLSPKFTAETFESMGLSRSVYVMDRIHVLPSTHGQYIRDQFYPIAARKLVPTPALCRLYFGKVLAPPDGTRRTAMVNSNNFPLDKSRYIALCNTIDSSLPSAEAVAKGMGQQLGFIHWTAGFDARDIEFVIGGDGYGNVRFHVIDFNQMRSFSKQSPDIPALVSAFFANDPYYPRPSASDPLYASFRAGYVTACKDHRALGLSFLSSIENELQSRDSSKTD